MRVKGSIAMAMAMAMVGCGQSSPHRGSLAEPATTAQSNEAHKPPEQILRDAAAAVAGARSVVARGRLDIEGRPSTVSLEQEKPGRVRLEMDRDGAKASVITVAGQSYMKANVALLESTQGHEPLRVAVDRLLANRWLRVGSREAPRLGELNVGKLAGCLAHETGTLVSGGVTDFNGQTAIVITDKGDEPGSTPGRFYVAASGRPLLLGVVQTGSGRPGGHPSAACKEEAGAKTQAGSELTFSRYGQPLNIVAPAGAQTPQQLATQLGL